VMLRIRLVAAFAMTVVSATACTTEDAAAPSREPKEPRQRPAGQSDAPSELVYVKGVNLFLYDLDSGQRRKVGRLPSADVAVSPDGQRYAVVEETSPAGPTPEGFRKPVLRLGSIDGEDARELGPGRSPLWSPDGRFVAAIARAGGLVFCPDAIEEGEANVKSCQPTERVVAYRSDGEGAPKTLLGGNQWSLIGWTSDDRILATSLIFNSVVLGYPGASFEDAETLGLKPEEVWGISPSEYALLVVRDGRSFFAYPGEGEGATVELRGALLGDGAWSPDGKKVAAVAIEQRPHGSPRSKLVVIDVATGKVEAVPRSKNAQAAAAWSPSSESFTYVRVDPARASKLQAVLCSTELECETLFSWNQGVALLALR
jgi:hypothetical protein